MRARSAFHAARPGASSEGAGPRGPARRRRSARRSCLSCLALALVAQALVGCGGSSGSDEEPPPPPNGAPVLSVPNQLSGGPVRFTYALPVAGAAALTFTASDPDGEPLLWQVGVAPAARTATGLSFPSPVAGTSLTLDLQAVASPASAALDILVEDPRGAAAAIDLLVVRSGAPTITAVAPTSAFATAGQPVTVTGTAFSLGGSVNTTATFDGVLVGANTVVDDTTLTGTTPSAGVPGPRVVSVQNVYGSAALPSGAFRAYAYPVDLFANDTPLDAGAGAALAVAGSGPRLAAAWVGAGAAARVGLRAGARRSGAPARSRSAVST